jgi:protein-S-isoprenylcysteine O-methyltransferase Ste14
MKAQKESTPRRVSVRSLLLVGAQLVLLAGLAGTGPWWPETTGARVLVVAGVGLGVWAVITMRWRHLRATPEPAEGARLLTGGPYRGVRHPMYAATLLVVAGWLAGYATWPRGLLALALLAVLVLKLRYEERLLAQHFSDYHAYAQRTKRLVPWVW